MIKKIFCLAILASASVPVQADFWNVTSLGPISAKELADQGYNCTWGYIEPGMKFTWNALDIYFRCLKPNDSIILCGNAKSKDINAGCHYEDGPDFLYKGKQLQVGVFDKKLINTVNGHHIYSAVAMYKPSIPADGNKASTGQNQPKSVSPPPYQPPPVAKPVQPSSPPVYQPPQPSTPQASAVNNIVYPPAVVRKELSLDLNRYCKDTFGAEWTAGLQPNGGVNDWFCQTGRNDRRGMNLKEGCRQQHGVDELHFDDERDPNSGYCVKQVTELSLDLNKYCKDNFGAEWTTGLQPNGGINDWFCQMGKNERRGMNLREGCRQQHASTEIHFRDEKDPNSWYCVK